MNPSFECIRRLIRVPMVVWVLGLVGIMGQGQAALPTARDATFQTLGMDGLPNAAVVLPDGKVLIGGNFQNIGGVARPALARLNADGTLDGTFAPPVGTPGGFGKAIVQDLVVQADGRIVAAGSVSFRTTGVVRTNVIRFMPDGSVDPTLDVKDVAHFRGLAVQADGRIVLGMVSPTVGFRPARLTAAGAVDGSFTFGGGFASTLRALQFGVQADGRIVGLAGDGDPNRIGNQQLFRLNTDGSPDGTFKAGSPPYNVVDDSFVVFGPAGGILATIYEPLPVLVRFAADGTRDAAFRWSGSPNGQGVYPVAAALLPSGGVVAVRQPTAGDRRVSFFYLDADGSLLGTRDLPSVYVDNGVVGVGVLAARAFAVQPDGRLLFAEAFLDGSRPVFGMFRMPPPPEPIPPVITQQPQDAALGAGDFLSLTVVATSESPLGYRWMHSGTNLVGQSTATLSMSGGTREREGGFQVVVTNAFGSVTSRVATVTVRPPAPPSILIQPEGGTVPLSQSFTLAARIQTEVMVGYRWYKDGIEFRSGGGQATGVLSLLLAGGDATRSGNYHVVITNDYGGSVTSAVARLDLVLPGPPQITSQPSDLELFPGQPARLGVTAVGDGVPRYQWLREGTNLVVGPDIPSVTQAGLTVTGRYPFLAGGYSVVVTLVPGGSTTSRVAAVRVRPSGPAILLSQPSSLTLDLGGRGELSAVFNGEAPLSVAWQRAGTNVQVQSYAVLDGPMTNLFSLVGIPASAGEYQVVVTNRNGAVTSQVASVSVRAGTPAEIRRDLGDLEVPIGQFNTTNLASGLVVTNCCGQAETGHVLALTPLTGLGELAASGPWHLGIGISNRFYVGAQSGLVTTSGTWGWVPGGAGYSGMFLTNFPKAGTVARFEFPGDGSYSLGIVGSATASQNGRFIVLGSKRPATNSLAMDVYSTNAVVVTWYRNGQPATGPNLSLLNETLGSVPVGGVNNRYRLILGDVTPADTGDYWAVVSTQIRNPDPRGVPAVFVGASTTSRVARVTVKGWAEARAPGVTAAAVFGQPTGVEDVTSMAVQRDQAMLVGVRTVTFGGQTTARSLLMERSYAGELLASAAMDSEQLNGGDLGILRALVPDGEGGALVAGDGAGGVTEPWFIRRVRPAVVVSGGITNRTFTNLWTRRTSGPFTNGLQNLTVPHGAGVVAMVRVADGVVVAGHYIGTTRFGVTNVATNAALPLFTAQVGGITLTNVFDSTFRRHDGSKDAYVAKFDLLGNIVWARSYGGTNSETVTGLATDGGGNLYLSGSFRGGAVFGALPAESTKGGNLPPNPSWATDGFVARLDGSGEAVWVRAVGGLPYNESSVVSVAPDGLGGAYFAATRQGGATVLQPGLVAGARYLGRIGPSGDLLWTQDFNGQGNTRLISDAMGRVIISDTLAASSQKQTILLGAHAVADAAWVGTWVGKVDRTGLLLWARGLDEKVPHAIEARPVSVQAMAVDDAGGTVVAGRLSGGTTSSSSRSAGQSFDLFEMTTTGSSTTNSTDLFLARLAPEFVAASPSITMQPVGMTGALQDRVVLEGRSDGNPPPAYQWFRDGVAVPGATSRVLAFDEMTRTHAGTYTLVASNAFGVVTSAPAVLKARMRPEMTGWTWITSATNYLGNPSRVVADDAGNVYMSHIETARGAFVYLEAFRPDGTPAWRFESEVPGVFPIRRTLYEVDARVAPVVTPSGAVFIAGRRSIDRLQGAGSSTAFLARLDPVNGKVLWEIPELGPVAVGIVAVDVDAAGNARVALANRTVRRFDADGRELGGTTLAALPMTVDPSNSRVSFDRSGGYYFYGNRVESLALGPTNLPALGGNPGAQNMVLARYDATGAFQWSRTFSGGGTGVIDPFRVLVDAGGDALIAGSFGVGNQTGFRFAFGTNQLGGFGYAARVSREGDVRWAKSWFLHINDAVLAADGSMVLGGWFRTAAPGSAGDRRVAFGTNLVGAAITRDTFVAVVNGDGGERYIRHTGSPLFDTFDNARDYRVAVNTAGTVWTSGFTLVAPAAAAVEFGDARYAWPDLQPYNLGNLFGNLAAFYVARLDVDVAPPVVPEIAWEPPAPGSTTLRLTWSPGYRLQHRAALQGGEWQTLDVAPPFDADVLAATEGYFRIIKAP